MSSSRRPVAAPSDGPAPRPLSLRWAKAFRGVLLALAYVAVAAFALNAFQLKWGFREGTQWAFEGMLDGSVERPVAFRVLVPRLASAIAPLLPERAVRAGIEHGLEEDGTPKRTSVFARYGWKAEPEYFAVAVVAYLLQFASLLATLLAARALLREAIGAGGTFRDFAPAVGFLLLPLTYHRGGYVYDFPELMFCAVGLLLLVRGRLLAWYVCFALACLNKEADVLLAIYFLATQWQRRPLRWLAAHSALHVLVGGAILIGLRVAFADNAGGATAFHLPQNVSSLLRASTWFGFVDIYAPFIPAPKPFNLVLLFGIVSAVAIGWREKPWELRVAFVGTMACLVPLVLITGNRDEVRNFSLAFVPFCLLACDTVRRVYARLGEA